MGTISSLRDEELAARPPNLAHRVLRPSARQTVAVCGPLDVGKRRKRRRCACVHRVREVDARASCGRATSDASSWGLLLHAGDPLASVVVRASRAGPKLSSARAWGAISSPTVHASDSGFLEGVKGGAVATRRIYRDSARSAKDLAVRCHPGSREASGRRAI